MGFVPVKSKALEGVAATLLYPMVVSSFKSKSQMCKSNERKNNQLDIELQKPHTEQPISKKGYCWLVRNLLEICT